MAKRKIPLPVRKSGKGVAKQLLLKQFRACFIACNSFIYLDLKLEPAARIELATVRLQIGCSTAELCWLPDVAVMLESLPFVASEFVSFAPSANARKPRAKT